MKFTVYRRENGRFYPDGDFTSYRAAVLSGQERAGKGNFYVQTVGDHIPTRAEQLLETMKRPGKVFKTPAERRVRHELNKLRRSILHSLDKENNNDTANNYD